MRTRIHAARRGLLAMAAALAPLPDRRCADLSRTSRPSGRPLPAGRPARSGGPRARREAPCAPGPARRGREPAGRRRQHRRRPRREVRPRWPHNRDGRGGHTRDQSFPRREHAVRREPRIVLVYSCRRRPECAGDESGSRLPARHHGRGDAHRLRAPQSGKLNYASGAAMAARDISPAN